jgi:formamidopyrimidine-DNA glycosylase
MRGRWLRIAPSPSGSAAPARALGAGRELRVVETVRRRLAPRLAGRTIVRATIDDPRLTAPEPPEAVAAALAGLRVERLGRRGKYLIAEFAGGEALLVHLRMTGNLLVLDGPPPPALRARLELDDGSALGYADVRRFGTWRLLVEASAEEWLDGRLGPEPLAGWSPDDLRRSLRRRRAPVKAVLLDQRVVAGVGNIYADEALWRARIHPLTPAERVRGARVAALHGAVRGVLQEGIAAQGASIRDFRTPEGGYGSAQERFAVYGRAGEPCPHCGRPIERIVVAQRGTHLCRRCQGRGPGAPR